ncbi:MAG: HAD family hydrolase [Bacteroidia bacterium]|nr:HAD family hydrolase [Bacteroidia bacterium]MCX7764798.1 HAD family hydrolase [Bacteroidia bacterium]MDW8057994.1 HAD family hydrolase [Bacteroidia bacterium]
MHAFDRNWTLFLDRDGVLNVEKEGDYVRCWEEFMFLPKVLDALAILKEVFGRIIVVTNQRGVGRGLMTMADLNHIHQRMKAVIKASGGRIDAIYACTALENDAPCRKPNPGMAHQAKRDFPEIEFHRSVMVGNSESDMLFGRSLGMHTVWISTKSPLPSPPDLADEIHESLWAWALSLQGR